MVKNKLNQIISLDGNPLDKLLLKSLVKLKNNMELILSLLTFLLNNKVFSIKLNMKEIINRL